jgi:hypothetical protein
MRDSSQDVAEEYRRFELLWREGRRLYSNDPYATRSEQVFRLYFMKIQMERRARLQPAIAQALVDVEVSSEHTEAVAQQKVLRDGLFLDARPFQLSWLYFVSGKRL